MDNRRTGGGLEEWKAGRLERIEERGTGRQGAWRTGGMKDRRIGRRDGELEDWGDGGIEAR